MKKAAAVVFSLILWLSCVPSYADSPKFDLTAESALLMDMTTGRILYEKNAHEKRSPASTTKMLTCIIALENLDLSGNIIVKADEIAGIGGNSLKLKGGEEMNAGTMLKAMMVVSANDAAVVIANRIAGSVDSFVELMNGKLAEIGCEESHFVNPNGFHDDRQYSSCHDLARIARYCMQNETFRRIAGTATMTVAETNKSPARYLSSTNLMLYDETAASRVYVNNELRYCKYEGCIGIKTGYTSNAGGCLVSACTRQGTTLLSVVMKSGSMERFSDSIKLFDWGFDNYKTVRMFDNGCETGYIKVKGGKVGRVSTGVVGAVCATVPIEASKALLSTDVLMDESVRAPFEAGTKVGTLRILAGEELVGEADILTDEGVAAGGPLSRIGIADSTVRKALLVILAVLIFLAALLALYLYIEKEKARKRRAVRAARRAEAAKREAELRREWEKNYRNRYR